MRVINNSFYCIVAEGVTESQSAVVGDFKLASRRNKLRKDSRREALTDGFFHRQTNFLTTSLKLRLFGAGLKVSHESN